MFGERLKELRKDKNISQEELANIINVTKATISNWENDKGYADGDILIKLAEYFGVTTDYLLGFNQEDLDRIKTLKTALKNAGVNDIETAMQIISIYIDKKDTNDG